MTFLISLFPTTLLVVAGYIVVYISTQTEGGLKVFGKYFGIWVFFLAGVILLGGLLTSTIGMPESMGGIRQHLEQMQSHMEKMEKLQEEQLRELQKK